MGIESPTYDYSLQIGQRLMNLLGLIERAEHSTKTLALALGVSEPTISRCLAVLRRHGYEIRSRRNGRNWCYVLAGTPTKAVPVVRPRNDHD
ncbi:ArsR/SmtB family transcription factor [Zavarzinella formosa]|uniref:ArsR/SmtB family transcription factor n=1 Tax=Zavarzinella formosa TaxID=360055 RepID=UPI0012F81243